MTRTRRRGLLLLAVLAAVPSHAQGPHLPPPFDRTAPVGEPPTVPGVEKGAPAMDQPEALGRGPIHEGFAQPSDPTARPAPVVPKAPPAPVRESPPEQKPDGDNVVWVPGYWMWDDDRRDYLWVSGFWRVPPPGRKWVPGYWVKVEGGWRWVSGMWTATDQPAVPYTEAPPASLEAGPNQPAPGDSYQWIPGSWLPRDERWLWRPGCWVAPRPGWVFTPSRYCWSPRGYRFVNGFWDRDLQTRGLPFAPVFIPPSLYAAPNFMYTPRYALNVRACLGSLWARPGWNYYAFGDYYGPAYGRLGFQPWFQFGPRVRCPLFGYYRNMNFWRNPSWSAGLAATHQGRLNGTLPVPPRSFAAQARLGNPAVTTLLPLTSYRNASLPLVRTPVGDRAAVEKVTSAYLRAGVSRAREEQRPVPGGRLPGALSLSTVPTPSGRPLTAPRPAELSRPTPPAPRLGQAPPHRSLTLPPPRLTPAPSIVTPPTLAPRSMVTPRAMVPPSLAVPRFSLPPATRFSPPARSFTMPTPRPMAPAGHHGTRR